MAIIKLGITVVGIRRTIGGLTFSANKSGPYVKLWSKGSNPQTPIQATQRGVLGAMPALWRDLTPGEKAAWEMFAALPAQERTNSLGEAFFASGFNWFSIINIRLINMGRPPRTATPTQSRPSAPSGSSLVLPFLPQQATKVTYPSGTFNPDFDQVIDVGVTISSGRTVSIQNFLQLKLDQNPPDEDNEFVIPYLQRWNLKGAQLKGFLKIYRQTTDGLRSSPGTANFVSSDTPPYAATAKDYNGATNYALRGADWSGNADSKIITISWWFRKDGGDGLSRKFFVSTGTVYDIYIQSANKGQLTLKNSGGTEILNTSTTTAFLAGAAWHNIIWAVDLAAGTVLLAVDGALETPIINTGPTNDTIDWTVANHAVGANVGGTEKWDGCISEIYINNAEFVDITQAANLARFVDTEGFPVDLGETGAFPTGSQPIVYVRDGDPETNRGYGGNYVNQAALSACGTAPP